MAKSTKRLLSGLIPLGILLAPSAAPAGAASGDTVADRVLGQRRFSTSSPFFVDGKVFSATDVAVDRSATPNRVYLADAGLNRVLGWSDIGRFRAGASADLVLGQPSLFIGRLYVYAERDCPAPPSATSFCKPSRVAVDPRGNLYVADRFNSRVLEFDSPFTTDRAADRVFGQPDFTSRTRVARSNALPGLGDQYFQGLSVDGAGNVWMVDPTGTGRVLEFDDPLTHDTRPDRVIEPVRVKQCSDGRWQNRLCNPNDVEVSPQGDLYVQDFGISSLGGSHLFIFRQPLATDLTPDEVLLGYGERGLVFDLAGNLYSPSGWADRDSEGRFYIAGAPWPSYESNRVHVFEHALYEGEPVQIGRELLSNRSLGSPTLVAVDRSSFPNHLYVVDSYNRVLGWWDAAGFDSGAPADLVLDGSDPEGPSGESCYSLGTVPVVNASRFCVNGLTLGGLAVDSRGNLWLSDVRNHRVLEFDRPFETDGIADRVLGQGGSFTTRVCGSSVKSLCYPGALAFDPHDDLYVADVYNNRVLFFLDPLKDAVADKVFGQDGCQGPRANNFCFGYEEGDINVRFHGASGLAVDPQGNLYVADSFNARVLIFKDAAKSDTLADVVLGQDSFRTNLRGTGPRRFGGQDQSYSSLGPVGLAIGPRGELYVADPQNDRLLVFERPLRSARADRVFGHADFATGGFHGDSYTLPPPPSPARLLSPTSVAFDALGNLYVADEGYNRVLAFNRP
ncbi:MAG TPA: NHL repeat-containing protein [Thermoanaerobaculia bacterium]|jgi:sugar lactone lactonase YvrE|nr:NHL repeat-containing protein [Thermoanaerobaculia bacterium]